MSAALCRGETAKSPIQEQKKLVVAQLLEACSGLEALEQRIDLKAVKSALDRAVKLSADHMEWCSLNEKPVVDHTHKEFLCLLMIAEGIQKCLQQYELYRKLRDR